MTTMRTSRQAKPDYLSRRRLLGGLAASGTAAFAGCSNRNSDSGEGPVYRFLARISPTQTNWLHPRPPLDTLLYPPGQTLRPDGTVVPHTVESIDVDPRKTTVRLREGATWTNGEQLLGEDLGKFLELERALGPRPDRVRTGEIVPTRWQYAFTEFEWDGRELVLRSPNGRVADVAAEYGVWSYLNGEVGRRSRFYYDSIYTEFTSKFPDPWESAATHEEVRTYLQPMLDSPVFVNDGLRNPENVVSSGPWKLDTVGANRVELLPHEGHPTTWEGPAVPRVRIDPTNTIDLAVAALNSDQGDAFQPRIGGTGRFIQASAAADLPDHIRQFPGKIMKGAGVIANHGQNELLADRRVRAALMYAIDREETARNAHKVGYRPIEVPGLSPGATSRYSDDVVSGLRAYGQDQEKAAKLLAAAGFTKEDNVWITPGGTEFSLPILTVQEARIDRPSPLLVQSLEGQLTSFGIQAQLVPLEQAAASDKIQNGRFQLTADPFTVVHNIGTPYNRAAVRYASAVGFHGNRRPQLQFFDEELTSLVEESESVSWQNPENPGRSGIVVSDPEPLKRLTVEAPPLGEPDGALQDHEIVYLAARALTDWAWEGHESSQQEALETLLWVYNYDIPHFEIAHVVPQLYHNVDDWAIPDPDDDIWRYNGPRGYASALDGALLHGRIRPASPTHD